MLGPNSVEYRSKRSSSGDLQDSWLVLSAVLTVLTWYSMKPLGLGKGGDEDLGGSCIFKYIKVGRVQPRFSGMVDSGYEMI